MKIFTLKSLLLILAIVGGVNAAWADDVYTVIYGVPTYGTDGVTITGVTPQGDFTEDDGNIATDITSSDANGSNCTNAMPIGGSVLYSGTSFSKNFEEPATKGTVHFEANYTTTTNGQETWKIVDSNGVEIFGTTDAGYSNGNATKTWGFCNGESLGTNWFRQARKCHNRVVLDINLSTKKVSYTVLVSSGNNSYSTLTGTYDLPASVSDVAGLTATKQSYFSYMDNVSLYNVYDNAVSVYNYTINYQFEGETVASEYGAGEAGATVEAQSYVWNSENTAKYFVVDGEETTFTIAAGTNDFNVAVREAELWAYSVKAYDGSDNELAEIATGSVIEGETVENVYYSQYLLSGTTLYNIANNTSGAYYRVNFTPDANNYEKKLVYGETSISNVVYYAEGEEVDGVTVASNVDRASKGYMGHTGGNYLVATTLSAGKYKIYLRGVNSNSASRPVNFKIGEEDVVFTTSITTGSNFLDNSDEFVVAADETVLSVSSEGSSTSGIDWFYIVKTGDIPSAIPVTVTAAGYATLCSEVALDFTNVEGLDAYVAKMDGSTVKFTKVEAVPAGTGLLLKGEGDFEVPVVASAAEVAENLLVGVVEDTEIANETEEGNTNFVLMNGANGAGFYKVSADGFTVRAGSAYLSVAMNGEAKTFIGFDGGTATAIKSLENADAADDAPAYNVAGQRVNGQYKGIVVRNGRKIVMK